MRKKKNPKGFWNVSSVLRIGWRWSKMVSSHNECIKQLVHPTKCHLRPLELLDQKQHLIKMVSIRKKPPKGFWIVSSVLRVGWRWSKMVSPHSQCIQTPGSPPNVILDPWGSLSKKHFGVYPQSLGLGGDGLKWYHPTMNDQPAGSSYQTSS